MFGQVAHHVVQWNYLTGKILIGKLIFTLVAPFAFFSHPFLANGIHDPGFFFK
jgi:hypothetical protein